MSDPPPITGPEVLSIHIALASRLPMRATDRVALSAGHGIPGDRYENARHRHLTVQSRSELEEAADQLGWPVEPGSTRRNITISHGVVPSRPGERMLIGTVEVEVVRVAAPCKLLDDLVGVGARTAMRRRAGSVCRVLSDGEIWIGARADLERPN